MTTAHESIISSDGGFVTMSRKLFRKKKRDWLNPLDLIETGLFELAEAMRDAE